jgi:hypothetical protein
MIHARGRASQEAIEDREAVLQGAAEAEFRAAAGNPVSVIRPLKSIFPPSMPSRTGWNVTVIRPWGRSDPNGPTAMPS